MRVAFLVIATRSHQTFGAQVAWFEGFECDFFVHVDAKFPAQPFEAIARDCPNVRLIERRTPISWGGFAMIVAEVALMEAARGRGPYQRYVLVSDDTLPLRSPERIMRALAEPAERIGAGEAKDDVIRARYAKFYMNDFPAMSPKNRPLPERGVCAEQVPALLEFSRAVLQGKKPIPALYFGSQWWALSDGAVAHFLSVFHGDAHLRDSFRYSAIPDEHYIQTVLRQSPALSPRITHSPVYADFSRIPKPYVLSTMSDLDGPLDSNKLFARKFGADCRGLAEHLRCDPRCR